VIFSPGYPSACNFVLKISSLRLFNIIHLMICHIYRLIVTHNWSDFCLVKLVNSFVLRLYDISFAW
jgi:hypothetical protein